MPIHLIQKILKGKFLYIFDDSRSRTKNIDYLYEYIKTKNRNFKIKKFFREENKNKLNVNSDDYNPIV